MLISVLMTIVGLLFLLGGGEVLLRGAASLATCLGLSPLLIGLTVVAVGTSLPELVATIAAAAWEKWHAAEEVQPKDWVGTATETQLAFPYLNLWGFPDKFHRSQEKVAGQVSGIAGSPGVVEGIARVVDSEAEFDSLQVGEILVCQMTNPAWQVLYGKIIAVVTDAGGTVSHPAVLAREYGIPAVVGTSTGTYDIKTGDRIRVDGNDGVVTIL